MKTNYKGIDYGSGQSNINRETGIRYGVISQNSIDPEAISDMEFDYGEPTCPVCENEVKPVGKRINQRYKHYTPHGCHDFVCRMCKHYLDSSDVYGDEPIGLTYEEDGYSITGDAGSYASLIA